MAVRKGQKEILDRRRGIICSPIVNVEVSSHCASSRFRKSYFNLYPMPALSMERFRNCNAPFCRIPTVALVGDSCPREGLLYIETLMADAESSTSTFPPASRTSTRGWGANDLPPNTGPTDASLIRTMFVACPTPTVNSFESTSKCPLSFMAVDKRRE